jgi:hypothetical protein
MERKVLCPRILQLNIVSNIWCKGIKLHINFQINHLLPKKLINK